MSRKPEVIYATKIVQGKGEMPSRMVLLKHFKPNGNLKEYSVHMSAKYSTGWGYYGGWYFRIDDYPSYREALAEAKRKFNIRIKKYPEFSGQGFRKL